MDQITSGWQKLKSDSQFKCPKLFYNFTGNEDGYTVKFTDLVGFWMASSPTLDIVDYAKITRTSIDPSESEVQFKLLLQKLAQSLAEGTNTLRQEAEETEVILLQTVLKLPRPLQPLKWEFYLEPKGAVELGENILRPCLFEASDSKKKIDTLHVVIEDKDRVIAKLMDKLEGTTIDLSTIFPGITGSRSRKGQTTIKDAEKHVRGLKAFSKQDWLVNFRSDNPYAGFEAVGLSQLVAGCEKCPKHEAHQHDRWLSKLPKSMSNASQAAKELAEHANTSTDEDATASDTESDDFEIQRRKSQKGDRKASRDGSSSPLPLTSPSKNKTIPAAARSSSPMLPPPPPLPRQDSIYSSKSSTSTVSSGTDQAKTITPNSRLGKLNKEKRSTRSHKAQSEPQTSSSPAPPRMPSPSSPISSSPPPMPNLTTMDSRPKSSSSVATLSSLNPTTPPKPKPKLGRLNSFRTSSISASATPEHKRVRIDNSASDIPSSTQGTPSRRLGRLKTATSQSASQQQQRQSSPDAADLKTISENHQDEKGNDSDASTASTASSASPTPMKSRGTNAGNNIPSAPTTHAGASGTSTSQQVQSSQFVPASSSEQPEQPEERLTKEEKADRRREELKRKIAPTNAVSSGGGTGPTAGTGGLRKKRKF